MKKIKKFILPLAIIIALVIGFSLLRPAFWQARTLRAELKAKKETLANLEKAIENLRKLEETYEDLAEELAKVSYALPSQAEIPNILVQLEALAAENGLLFSSVGFTRAQESAMGLNQTPEPVGRGEVETEPQTEAEEERVKAVLANVKVTGKYESFKSYLRAIEASRRIMDVSSIDFSSASREEAIGLYSYNLSIKIYYQ